MSDFHEDNFDKHLWLGAVELFDDLVDVDIGFFVGDDDERARFGIDLNKGVAKHGVVEVLARAFGCGVASETAEALSKGVRPSEQGGGQRQTKDFSVCWKEFAKVLHRVGMGLRSLLTGGAANGLGIDGSVVKGVVSLIVLSSDRAGDAVEAVFEHSAQNFGDIVGVGVFQGIDVDFLFF